MPAAPTDSADEIKEFNIRYHDAAAAEYDAKWGIDFGAIGQQQVSAKLAKALGGLPETPFAEALEIGAGTGYFSLNLLQLGIVSEVTATDISQGMLETLAATANRLGVEVATRRCEAERLPFEGAGFDLVFGHAVLHHIPDLEAALREFRRVLRPGGVVAFCGEPSRYGDRLATVPKRAGTLAAPAFRRLLGAPPPRPHPGHGDDGRALESKVDVHAFAPAELRRMLAAAGFEAIRVRGEELLANAYGWLLRTLESGAEPEAIPLAWRRFAFRSYIALQRLDTALLEPRLPPELFYNLLISARKPG